MTSALIVQEETARSGVLTEMLEHIDCVVRAVRSTSEAFALLSYGDVDVIFIDQEISSDFATTTLASLKEHGHWGMIPAVVLTSPSDSVEIIECMRLGAFDHLGKPAGPDELRSVINRAVARPKQAGPDATDSHTSGEFLVGLSPVMRGVEKLIGIAAACEVTVLIQGETGTGKDTVARAIHRHSSHRQKPLTVVDCTAVPEDYESFQCLASGSRGTIILDEVGDLNVRMQAMLVRALKESPVEGPTDAPAQLRIIAITQYDLIDMVKEKLFREDLYYRLNVLPIHLPPLRERGSDILALAETFLQQAGADSPKRLSTSAAKLLLDHQWPGNVRELQNLMYHLSVAVRARVIEPADLTPIDSDASSLPEANEETETMDYYTVISSVERNLLVRALEAASGSRSETARLLGINRQLLYSKLKAHGLMNYESGGK